LYLYSQSLPHSVVAYEIQLDSLGQLLAHLTMVKQPQTSQTASLDVVVAESFAATSSMLTTTPKSHLHGQPSVLVGYQSMYGIHSGVSSFPWLSPMSSSGILPGSYYQGQHFDPTYQY